MTACYDRRDNQVTGYYPCSTDGSLDLAQCCSPGDSCASNGLCVASSLDDQLTPYFIDGCTVSGWVSNSSRPATCLAQCVGVGTGVKVCGEETFCCYGYTDCDCNNATAVFTLGAVRIVTSIATDIASSTLSSASSTSTLSSETTSGDVSASTTATSTTSASPFTTALTTQYSASTSSNSINDNSNSSQLGIGLAVGLGVAVPLTLCIVAAMWVWNRKQRRREARLEKKMELENEFNGNGYYATASPVELYHDHRVGIDTPAQIPIHELPTQPLELP